MKIQYDEHTDTLTVVLRQGAKVVESDEEKPGLILDYDEAGQLVSLEILDVSKHGTEAKKIEFSLAE